MLQSLKKAVCKKEFQGQVWFCGHYEKELFSMQIEGQEVLIDVILIILPDERAALTFCRPLFHDEVIGLHCKAFVYTSDSQNGKQKAVMEYPDMTYMGCTVDFCSSQT